MLSIKSPQNHRKKPTKKQRKKAVATAKKTVKNVRKMSKTARVALLIVVILVIAALVAAGVYFRADVAEFFSRLGNSGDPDAGSGSGGGADSPDEDGRFSVNSYQNTAFFGDPPVLSDLKAQLYFVNVGQGSSLLIVFDDGTTFLADAGCTPVAGFVTQSAAETNLRKLLLGLNLSSLDYVLATHPDADHVSLLSKIFDDFQVNCTIYNDIPAEITTQTYNKFRDKALLEPNSKQMKIAETGFLTDYDGDGSATTETIRGGATALTIYAPGYNNQKEGFKSPKNDKNSMSPICILSTGARKVLFTGDSTVTTEAWFLRQITGFPAQSFDVDVLFVGHHGSNTSTGAEFLDKIKPEYAVISSGAGNSYKHPTSDTMDKLKARSIVTYRTDTHGTLALRIDAAGAFGFLPENRIFTFNNTSGVPDRMLAA